MEKLTLPEAIRIAKEVVAEKGSDYVYMTPDGVQAGVNGPGCVNWNHKTNAPSCLIGHILHRHGISGMTLLDKNKAAVRSFGQYLENDAAEFLNILQERQDNGGTWGDALDDGIVYAYVRSQ